MTLTKDQAASTNTGYIDEGVDYDAFKGRTTLDNDEMQTYVLMDISQTLRKILERLEALEPNTKNPEAKTSLSDQFTLSQWTENKGIKLTHGCKTVLGKAVLAQYKKANGKDPYRHNNINYYTASDTDLIERTLEYIS